MSARESLDRKPVMGKIRESKLGVPKPQSLRHGAHRALDTESMRSVASRASVNSRQSADFVSEAQELAR